MDKPQNVKLKQGQTEQKTSETAATNGLDLLQQLFYGSP